MNVDRLRYELSHRGYRTGEITIKDDRIKIIILSRNYGDFHIEARFLEPRRKRSHPEVTVMPNGYANHFNNAVESSLKATMIHDRDIRWRVEADDRVIWANEGTATGNFYKKRFNIEPGDLGTVIEYIDSWNVKVRFDKLDHDLMVQARWLRKKDGNIGA